jgi:hypothetical protein
VSGVAELGLYPVIFDTTLSVEAQVLRDRAVGQIADMLRGNAVQPVLAAAARQLEHRAMRAVHDHGLVNGGALLTERVAVVPDGAGVGPRFGGGNC